MSSIWDKYPNFSENELRTLVLLSVQIMLESESGKSEFSDNLLDISSFSASRQILPLLEEAEADIDQQKVQELLEDNETSKEICLAVLQEIRKYPELVERISQAYEERTQKMTGIELLLLTGAIVILAIRIKEIRWSEEEKKITFYESGEAVKSFITGLLKASGS